MTTTFKYLLYALMLYALTIAKANAQNLENVGKKGVNPVTITGGINFNQIFYSAVGLENRRDPYNYFLSGNLNFNIYGWTVPLSFAYSNQNSSFQQPFNQYGISPTYKWVKAYIGYNSLSFSPYTLNGHIFNGIGLELQPGEKFTFSVMYGRLLKQQELDTAGGDLVLPVFRRMGFSWKIGYNHKGTSIDWTVFKAKDDVNSIPVVPDSLLISPGENFATSLFVKQQLFERISIYGEIANSSLSPDIQQASNTETETFGRYNPLFMQRNGSSNHSAFKGGITYAHSKFNSSLNYERIDPGYQTYGAYYFNNDLENISINFNTTLLKNKVNLGFDVGKQRDDLNNNKLSSMSRTIGSVSLGVVPIPTLNLGMNYSNFTTYTDIRSIFEGINSTTPYDNLDTLDFSQVSSNANLNVNWRLSQSKSNNHVINLNTTYQETKDKQGFENYGTGTQFYNAYLAYSYSVKSSGTSITASLNFNQMNAESINSKTLGPVLAFGRAFLDKKLKTSAAISWNQTYNNEVISGNVTNFRLGSNYNIERKHFLNLTVTYVDRTRVSNEVESNFKEFTAMLAYTYNFSFFNSEDNLNNP